jgi:D-sedoheptulose 7-phosphate isomerase
MQEMVQRLLRDGAELRLRVADTIAGDIAAAAQCMIRSFQENRKVVAFGNGGSAADAQHFTAELVGRFIADRPALPAISFAENPSTVTSIANDYGYDHVFARQVEAHVKPGDTVVGFSTSGNSANVLLGLKRAREIGAKTVGLAGRRGGRMVTAADTCVIVPHEETARIQEMHIAIVHTWCELIERGLFRSR